jgi:hypothetical protein
MIPYQIKRRKCTCGADAVPGFGGCIPCYNRRQLEQERRERMQTHAGEMYELLKLIELWEAELITTDACWKNEYPTLTQEIYDKWMALQRMRNEVIAKVEGGDKP